MSTPVENNDDTSNVEPDDIGVGMLTVVGALCAVVLLLIVVLVQAWFYNWKDRLEAQRIAPVDVQSAPATVVAEQSKKLESYHWADEKNHIRAIPISRAMELIVREYGATPSENNGDIK
jgi:hypothetical protein